MVLVGMFNLEKANHHLSQNFFHSDKYLHNLYTYIHCSFAS